MKELKTAILGVALAFIIAVMEGILIINHMNSQDKKINIVQTPINKN